MTTESTIVGAGCFWGVEWVFRQVPGVIDAVSGYAGGTTPNPTYREVCSHTTGHAEAVRVTFDPSVISYEQLLEVFWAMHDPTQVDRQGPDIGDQYRSVIFTETPEQEVQATASKAKAQTRFSRPIAPESEPPAAFSPAEDYPQRYYDGNGPTPYCHVFPADVFASPGLTGAKAG